LAERVGVIEIDLPDGVRVRVDSSVNEKALRRVLARISHTAASFRRGRSNRRLSGGSEKGL